MNSYISLSIFALTSIACGLFASFLALFAMVAGKNLPQRLFAYFNIAVSLWGYGCFIAAIASSSNVAILGWKIALIGGYFIGTLLYHLVWEICAVRSKKFLYFAYGQAILLTLIMLFNPALLYKSVGKAFDFINIRASWVLTIAVIIFYFLVGISYKELIKRCLSTTGRARQQTAYFIFGLFFGFLGAATIVLPWFGLTLIYPFGNIGICIYVIILAYAIFKHNLLDIKIVIKRAVIYSCIVALVSFIYLGTIFVLHALFFTTHGTTESFATNMISILLIAVLFKPAEIFVTRILERRFFQGTISEIAEQKHKLETELERRERLKSVGILAAGMAHEIKNPITAIKTFAEYLPKKYDDPEFREKFTKIVQEETERISRIVKDLLLFSKPSEPNRQTCDLHQIIKDVIDLLSSDILKNKIILQIDFDSSVGKCHVDPAQMKQAFLNILMNAIDAMPNGGMLKVTTSLTSDLRLLISVSDTGCGIPKDKIGHIFDPFYTDKEQGTGLGLAVTHSIVEKNGGKIEVGSETGAGTVFTITLPLHR